MRRKWNKPLDEANFQAIKDLLSRGATAREVRRITNYGATTIYHVKKSRDLADFHFQANPKFRPQGASVRVVNFEQTKDLGYSAKTAELLAKLENRLEEVKLTIAELSVQLAEDKIRDYKTEKEAELASLRAVVDAAKTSNLAQMIKERLMSFKS